MRPAGEHRLIDETTHPPARVDPERGSHNLSHWGKYLTLTTTRPGLRRALSRLCGLSTRRHFFVSSFRRHSLPDMAVRAEPDALMRTP